MCFLLKSKCVKNHYLTSHISCSAGQAGHLTSPLFNQTIYYLNSEKQVKSLDFNGNVSLDVLPVSNDTQDLQMDTNNR